MKHIHRFFVSTRLSAGDSACLDEDDSFHASRVLRLKEGDAIELADVAGHIYAASVTDVDRKVEVRAGEELEAAVATVALTVAQSIPRGSKMDLIAEKLSELGVDRLVPLFTEKSVAAPGSFSDRKVDRWRRVARAAAAQSRRPGIMSVDRPRNLESWLEEAGGGLIALATETEGRPLGELLPEMDGRLSLVIGPEAGFAPAELRLLEDAGAVFAGLGPLVLRTETAALVAVTVIMHRAGTVG